MKNRAKWLFYCSDCVNVLASQRFLVLGDTATRFRAASRAALSYRILSRSNITNGYLCQRW